MHFFSAGRRGGGLLPSSAATSKVKPLRKPSVSSSRRRGRFRDLLSSTSSFAIGLSISLLCFIAIVVLYGVPSPLSSSHPKYPVPSRSAPRRPFPAVGSFSDRHRGGGTRDSRNIAAAMAVADITTKDLYDRIEFVDEDGGAWKQGWNVTYLGNEWDDEKLKVFVVPHSHNDPGWKLTVEEYYNRQSRYILDTIVETLSKDSRRKFIWEEMSYLERWWRDASSYKKETFIKLVKNGQLEIVGGGWVMNDEANSHYFAIIEQITEGNMWLYETIGVIPKNSWSIDPFGYSATMSYLLRRMGFHNMLIQRTHYELKKELALYRNLEFIWRQSWDMEETTDIFVHMMPFYSYDIPHTCGPEPAVCCQFDFARMRGFSYEACPWRLDPVETNPNNVQERAIKLLDQYRKKSTLYRTNTLLVPLGDDFRYVTIDEAEVQFRNYQMLFDYINTNHNLKAEVMFGTLEDYFNTLREEAERKNFSQPGEMGSAELVGFPSLSGDFFTYADRNQDYWSGYYVSRPFFKAFDRILEQTLRASEILAALTLGYCQKLQCVKLPISFSHKLTAARRNLALFQHHDGVTGTAKDHVVIDYGTRMHTALQDLQIFMSRSVEVLLGDFYDKKDPTLLSHFEPEQSRSKIDFQPVHKVLSVIEGDIHSVILFNPLEQTRDEVVMVVVSQPDVSVWRQNGSCVKSQISPNWKHDDPETFSMHHRIYWRASVAAMGLETYYVGRGSVSCEKATPVELRIFSDIPFSCPSPYVCTKIETEKVQINNLLYALTFDVKRGLLEKINHKDGKQTYIGEEISLYTSSGSGAYLFKPIGDAKPIIEEGGQFIISDGPIVLESLSIPRTMWKNTPICHSTRIYRAENTVQELLVEKEYYIKLIGHEFNDRELIVRFKTDIGNKRVFYTDLNGFQMSRRQMYDKIPLQGNYYSMPSIAFMQDAFGRRFSVHSKQSLGAASLKDGWLEIMLDRRLANDDGRGLGQGVMDNRPMNVLFHILTESNVSALPSNHMLLTLQPSILSHQVAAHLNYPIHAFVSNSNLGRKTSKFYQTSFSPLSSSLPCDLHIVNFKVPQPMKFSQVDPLADPLASRFVILMQRKGWDSSFCKRGGLQCSTIVNEPVNLFYLFKDLAVFNVKATSLNLLHDDTEMLGYMEQSDNVAQDGNVLISPMEIQAYKLDLQLQSQVM